MHLWLSRLWNDERGTLLVTDWVFIATILVLAISPTVASVRDRMHQARSLRSPFGSDSVNRAVLRTAAKL
jgi:hypothetical protein